MSTNHNLFEEKGEPKRYRTEGGPSVYQPNALPLGQTGSHFSIRPAPQSFIHADPQSSIRPSHKALYAPPTKLYTPRPTKLYTPAHKALCSFSHESGALTTELSPSPHIYYYYHYYLALLCWQGSRVLRAP